jgi:hypothetical protein
MTVLYAGFLHAVCLITLCTYSAGTDCIPDCIFSMEFVISLHEPGFDSRQEQEIFLFSKTSTAALGPTHPPI